MKRRQFLHGAAPALAGAAALTPTAAGAAARPPLLVYVFLRGGADGLNILPPLDGPDRARYERYRPTLQVPVSGPARARPLASQNGVPFGLHPAAAPLHELFDAGHLAIVQAVGMPRASRSHFDAMAFSELGTPGVIGTPSGWLARHLATADGLPERIALPALAVSATLPTSLLSSRETVTMLNPEQFSLGYSHWKWDDPAETPFHRDATLQRLYGSGGVFADAGAQALNASEIINRSDLQRTLPGYPDSDFASALATVAQLARLDVGLRVAAVELGAWDTHTGQDDNGFFTQSLLGPLASGLAAFQNDLERSGDADRVIVLVQSEFGRRVFENADRGTDHGSGNLMFVLGKTVNGGRLYGRWPGLAEDQLFAAEDLAYSTDFRQVIGETLQRRMRNPYIGAVFPQFSLGPALGLFGAAGSGGAGDDIIFGSGFE